jgi:hypothetical protein
MRILGLEIKKVISSYAIWGFMMLCLAFNALLVFDNGRDAYAEYAADVSKSAGFVLGQEFDKKLAALPESEYRELLTNDIAETVNVFAGYDVGTIAEAYIDKLKLSGKIAEDMREKYAALQDEVDKKAERGDSLTLYFAWSTYSRHGNLFGSVMSALCMEGILISLLVSLLALGYENHNRTEQIIYSAKVGRRIVIKKYVAAVIVGLGAYLLLAAMTLAMHFALNDYGNVWGSNVSSAFNAIRDIVVGGFRPFATWRSFTVLSYLIAAFSVSLGIILCFSLMGFAAGTWIRNSYIAFLAVFLTVAFCISFPTILPNNSYIRFGIILTPIWLWLKQPLWFTDGAFDILWRNFETRGLCLSLAVLAALAVFTAMKFKKREIV